jgi:hypothetical protein
MLHLIMLRCTTECCSQCNVKGAATGEMPLAAGRSADPFSTRATMLSTSFDRGGAEGDLMELEGWSTPQMLEVYGGNARGARARRSYDRIMNT